MSLPDWLLEEPGTCAFHGSYEPCVLCEREIIDDLYADMKIQDEKEGK